MICPYCSSNKDKVIDSRSTEGGSVIRRRRECLKCERRYTTYERVEQASRLTVIKKDGSRVPFNRDNVLAGVRSACGKRPIAEGVKKAVVDEVDDELHSVYEREVASTVIGERVMAKLRSVDLVAYIRFATEHLQLSTLEEIRAELDELRERPPDIANQEVLFEGR